MPTGADAQKTGSRIALKKYLTKKGTRIGAIVVVAALLVALITSALGGRSPLISNLSGSFRKPVQKAAQSLADWLGDIYGYMFLYDSIQEENESLKSQLAEAEEKARSVEALEKENERLNELLGFTQNHSDYETQSARVIARSSSNWSSTLTISQGKKNGISVGDPVITENGYLVGQVTELGSNWATVSTVTDAAISIGAVASESGSTGMIQGDYTLMQKGLTQITYLPNDSQIFEGDTVVTSGVGGQFPYGLVIGTVSSVKSEAGGQVELGIVKPSCDLGKLVQVFVITKFNVVG